MSVASSLASRNSLDAAPAPPARVIAPPTEAALAAAPTAGPELARALLAAVRACQAAPHDATNQHHGYAYTSAEAVIREGRAALLESGLALIPLGYEVRVVGPGLQAEHELRNRMLL